MNSKRRLSARLKEENSKMLTAVACLALSYGGGEVNVDLLKEIPVRMREFEASNYIAGTVTLIAAHGKIIEFDATGYRDRESRAPMQKDTIFQIMSMTKPVTAAAVMILAEEGKISLRARIDRYLPEFRDTMVGDKKVQPPTVQQVLSHTGGFASDIPTGLSDEDRGKMRLGEVVKLIAKEPLKTAPGETYRYAGPGYAVLGRIVEVVSGQSFQDFCQSRIFGPLKMSDTSFFIPKEKVGRLASVYVRDGDKLNKLSDDPTRPGAVFAGPAGGLYSTAVDQWSFFQCLANKGVLNGKRILSEASVETMSTVQTGDLLTDGTGANGYGLGLIITRAAPGTLTLYSIGSFGHSGAFGTQGFINPARGTVGIYMAQILGADDAKNAFISMANASVNN